MVTTHAQVYRTVRRAPPRAAALVAMLWSAQALAQGAPPDEAAPSATTSTAGPPRAQQPVLRSDRSAVARLLHEPPSAAEAHEPLRIEARLVHAETIARALLLFRTPTSEGYREIEFRRSVPGPYLAVVDEARMVPPYLEYTVELELRDGRRVAVLGSRRAPHRVQIAPDTMDVVEEALDSRVEGRRNAFSAGGEYVSFGSSEARLRTNGHTETTTVRDEYYRVEAGYTHRLLGWVPEFGIRAGVLRGSVPVTVRELQPGQDEADGFDVGLNYGSPWLRFRIVDMLHVDASVLISVNEVGFQVGAGTSVHIGDPYGSKLTIGVEGVQEFGTRLYTQLDIQAHDLVRVAPVIEVTNAPSADRFGVRVLAEIGTQIGYGFTLTGRGGYQARTFTAGGPCLGGALGYAF
jgi:hypothetical protein